YARSRRRGSAPVSRQPRRLRPESELLSGLAVAVYCSLTMIRLRWFLLGVVFCGAMALLAAVLVLLNAHGFSARAQPTAVEEWIARRFRSAALPSDARARTNP